jgi:ABC-type transport system involved in multi-copper enzyme maturation permease subunit
VWAERLAAFWLLVSGLTLWWYSSSLAPAVQAVLWATLLLGLAWTVRRGCVQLFGPVLVFDMIRTGRRGRHILFRALYALLLLAVLFIVYSASLPWENLSRFPAEELASFASSFFYVFMAIQFVAVFWLTPAYTAGAIALEKERRTLEFLLSTDLRNREIVLSLFVSRLMNLALLLLAGLPVLSMLQFMGGVDPNLVLAGFAALGLTMASLAGLGTVNSLYARKPSQAIVRTYLIMLVYMGLSTLSSYLLLPALNLASFPSTDDWTSPITLQDVVELINIGNIDSAVMQLRHEVGKGGRIDLLLPDLLAKYAWFHGLITVGCCVWTMVRLRSQVLQSGKIVNEESLVRMRAKRPRWGLKRAIRARLRDRAILWKELFVGARPGRRPLRSLYVGVILAIVFLPVMHLFYFFGRVLVQGSEDALAGLANLWVRAASGFLGSLLLLGVAVRAAAAISRERDQQTLDGLLATPLDNRTILLDKWLGSLVGEWRTWLILGLVWAIGYWAGALHPLAIPCFLLAWLGYALFLAGLGLWFSVANRSSTRALFGTLLTTALGLAGLFLAAFDIPSYWLSAWLAQRWEYLFMPPVILGLLTFSPQNYQDWLSSELKLGYYPLLLAAELVLWYAAGVSMFFLANIRFRVVTGRTSEIAERRAGRVNAPVTDKKSTDGEEDEWEYVIPQSRRPKRILARTLLVLPLLFMLGWYGLRSLVDGRNLQQAIADADRLDPGWRLEELEAKREVIPDEENSALLVKQVTESLSPIFWQNESYALFEDLAPEKQLNDQQITLLKEQLRRVEPAVLAARRLAAMSKGRYSPHSTDGGFSALVAEIQDYPRTATNLLKHDVLLRAQNNDADGALDSCRAILNAGRSIGDEPSLTAMMVRHGIHLVALRSIERSLAQGQPARAGLEPLQRLLEDEQAQPLLLIGLRGERAWLDRLMEKLREGRPDFSQWMGRPKPDYDVLLSASINSCRASLLDYNTEVVEAAKLPADKRAAEFSRIESSLPNQSMAVRQMAPAWGRIQESFRAVDALLRCAIVALAVERYRVRHGHWPESLADLTADLLTKIPRDPYLGTPLRYRRLSDGVVIYSVGPDGNDDGGKIARKNPNAWGTDIGIQLWDPDKRRQAAPPPKKTEDDTETPDEDPKSP